MVGEGRITHLGRDTTFRGHHLAPPIALGVVLAVALFRRFDITKPFPAIVGARRASGWLG